MPVSTLHAPAQGVPTEVSLPRSSWLGKVFSFPVMAMFILGVVIVGKAPQGIGLGEPDIWWRLRSAADFVQHPSFSSLDTYSFTAAGSHWTNFEWLSDLLFYAAYKAMGLLGMMGLYSAAMVLIFAGVYYRSCRAGANCKDAALATFAGICLATVSLAPRPSLFGWMCLTVLLLVLDRFRQTGNGLWVLPPLFLVWVNLHGSWIYGMAVLAITIICGLVQGRWGILIARRWSPQDLKKLLLASAVSVAALFVNPFGYKLVAFPMEFYRMRGFMKYVEYWRPVDFGSATGKLTIGFLLAMIAIGVFSRRPWRLDEVVLMAFALWSGLSHVRFLDLTAILCVPILTPHLRLFPPYEPDLDKPWLNAAIMVASVAILIAILPSENQLRQKVESQYPAAALAYIRTHQVNGRMFNPAEFGGYIEWTTPGLKIFADGRAVFVENGAFQDSFDALIGPEPFKVLDKYDVGYVLLEPTWPLAEKLANSSDWQLMYSSAPAVVFQRKAPEQQVIHTD